MRRQYTVLSTEVPITMITIIVILRTLRDESQGDDLVMRNHEDVDEAERWGLIGHVGSCSI
jgi:hypothetical protein